MASIFSKKNGTILLQFLLFFIFLFCRWHRVTPKEEYALNDRKMDEDDAKYQNVCIRVVKIGLICCLIQKVSNVKCPAWMGNCFILCTCIDTYKYIHISWAQRPSLLSQAEV